MAADCYSGLGWSKFQQEKYSEAIKSFQKVLDKAPGSPLEADALLRIADSYYNLHDYEKASDNYKAALSKDIGRKAIDAKEQMGWCAYRQEDFTQAVSLWSALIKNDDAASRKSKLLYWTAWAYFRNKHFKNAQQLFGQVENDYPNDSLAPEAHLREGDCYFNLQQFKERERLCTFPKFYRPLPDPRAFA